MWIDRRWHRCSCSRHKDCDPERERDGSKSRCSPEQGRSHALSQTGGVYHRRSLSTSTRSTTVSVSLSVVFRKIYKKVFGVIFPAAVLLNVLVRKWHVIFGHGPCVAELNMTFYQLSSVKLLCFINLTMVKCILVFWECIMCIGIRSWYVSSRSCYTSVNAVFILEACWSDICRLVSQ